ncbi:MAG TPA: serine/threonine-protein kinase [Polyangiaceae bacterium]|nr:serine/threonine-protein kinase [Polyangiaceae bacterium]
MKELIGSKLAETVSPESYQRALDPDHPEDERDKLPKEGDIVGNHYKLVRRLGEGMFGRVYVAERTDVPEHRVALKALNRAVYAGRNVERELVMLAAATHPNIVELKDHGMTEDYVWLTMPLYNGETLADRLKRGPLGLREAYEIFLPIARGVAALHTRGLRHQDIKPENIYLAEFAGQLHPVVLDLGVAVESHATFIAGTALFAAPEQLAALAGVGTEGRLTEKMDTYCLASTLLYALVTEEFFPGARARTPFDIANAFEVRETTPLAESALPELAGKPREMLAESFSRWLMRDAEERPGADDLAVELEVLLEKEREERRAVARGVRRTRTALWVIAVLSVIGLASFALWGYSKRTTLKLAGELEKAKAEGAKSYDKLETCNAAVAVSQGEVKQCNDTRTQETQAHEGALNTLRGEKNGVQEQLTTSNNKLNTCEDDHDALKTKHEDMEKSFGEKQKAWEEEKKTLSEATKTCQTDLEKIKGTQQTCQQELASCKSGDIYQAPAPGQPKEDPYD